MYQPVFHREDRLDKQHELIRAFPLGTLVTLTSDGLNANLIPFHLDTEAAPKGVLKAHVARANPIWKDYDANIEALVVFQGPEIYVSANYYASKQETGKVVPTWNYATVQAYGKLKTIEDKDWLLAQIRALTDTHEADQPKPWSIEDAPKDYIDMMLKGIVGLEIEIARIEGKWKMSQNRLPEDRESVVAALRQRGGPAASAVADLVDAARKTPPKTA